jgi:hypothetical protein
MIRITTTGGIEKTYRMTAVKAELNKNGFIDEEDAIHGRPFPNPREFFRYIPC